MCCFRRDCETPYDAWLPRDFAGSATRVGAPYLTMPKFAHAVLEVGNLWRRSWEPLSDAFILSRVVPTPHGSSAAVRFTTEYIDLPVLSLLAEKAKETLCR